jgi:hypothetical protein
MSGRWLIGLPSIMVYCSSALMPAVSAQTATIVESGSTNTAGFRIVIPRSGPAEYTAAPRRIGPPGDRQATTKQQVVPRELVDRFYADLKAAAPLSSLPEQRCMKSVSFGTTRTIEFDGQKTPDLNCGDGGNLKLRSLIQDANDIVKAFGVPPPGLFRRVNPPR